LVGLLVFIGAMGEAAAACTFSSLSDGSSYYKATLAGISPPAFDPAAYAVGQTIYKGTGAVTILNGLSNGAAYVSCSPTASYWVAGVGTPDANAVYPTSVQGVGLRMVHSDKTVPYQTSIYIGPNDTVAFYSGFTMQVEFVKTGTIPEAGGTLSGAFLAYRAGGVSGQTLMEFSWALPVVVKPQIPTCVVKTTDIRVSLGSVAAGTVFKGVGSVSPTVSDQITLTCSGGFAASSTNASLTFTDATKPSNVSNTLTLTSASTAKGIGIQVLSGGIVRSYGPDSKVAGNTNQWLAGNIAQGKSSFTIPLQFRYIQTASSVTAGSANGNMTFTMSYQ
jgi:type 1 fimbria pilin